MHVTSSNRTEEDGVTCLSCGIPCIRDGLTLHSLGLDNGFQLTWKKQLPTVGGFLASPLDPKLTLLAFKSKQQLPESDLFHKRN